MKPLSIIFLLPVAILPASGIALPSNLNALTLVTRATLSPRGVGTCDRQEWEWCQFVISAWSLANRQYYSVSLYGHDCHEVGGRYDRAIGENTEGISIPTGLGPSVDIKSNMPDLYFNYAGRITYLNWGHSYPCGRDYCYSVNYVC